MRVSDTILAICPCDDGEKWLTEHADWTAHQLWTRCPHGDWLIWVAHEAGVDIRDLVWCAAQCARSVLHYVPAGEDRPMLAVGAAEAWCRGEIDAADVDAAASAQAADAASAAAYAAADAASAAADAAVEAASAAAYADAYAAAYAASAARAADADDDSAARIIRGELKSRGITWREIEAGLNQRKNNG